MADRHVLHIPELLTLILLQLSPHHLLKAQAVSRFWKSVIDDTPAIQQALFFAPVPVKTPVRVSQCEDDPFYDRSRIQKNPFIKCTHLGAYLHSKNIARINAWVATEDLLGHVRYPYCADFSMAYVQSYPDLQEHVEIRDWESFERPEASWKKMLIAQSEGGLWKTASVNWLSPQNQTILIGSPMFHKREGLNLGDLADRFEKFVLLFKSFGPMPIPYLYAQLDEDQRYISHS